MKSQPSPRILASIEDVAERYDVHPKTIRRRIADGTVPAYRVGRQIRIDLAEADAAMLRPIPTHFRGAAA
ncbi:helix-turn-helix domain-containing protein [Cellulosimicrobium sp. E-16]|uniref:helix-turn-helix domain-containing protein n=1 Tax=Cellulosimicrobium sp. E-16 TaxID=3404049 RepID=UPI003CFBB654